MSTSRVPVGRLVLFVVLSFLDLGLTWMLLMFRGGRIYEGNPIAQAWLNRYGWPGLVFFKITAVSLIAVVAILISRYRPRTAARLMTFACVAVGAVLLYSTYLALTVMTR